MSPGLDARAKIIFGDAIEYETDARRAFIAAACAGDEVLRQRVEVLLAAAEKDDQFLGPDQGGGDLSRLDAAERPGMRIGRYTLIEKLGEGGFGTVFLAEQEQPVRRRVALKIIKFGMDTRAVIARFEQERQALAIMDHPNIARVFDAGATENGRPFFVMEHVAGEPITSYCDRANLTIADRLALLMQVCRAVQHAHTKGVIHRDIKPVNVLVSVQDETPVCKVIDFGIAKAVMGPLTDKTLFTEARQLIGTPEYMSPEQAAGSTDIDTRSDVYSLGVLAYELLAGAPPFDPQRLRSAAYGEMQRIIREVDPPAPSTRLSLLADKGLASIAAQRASEPGRLGAMLKGELDWIVMKALEKDPGRRYESPSELAADVQRFLSGEPVAAAPAAMTYRVRKFVGRNRVVVSAAGLVTLALVLGILGTGAGLINARRSLQRALDAEHLAQQRLGEAELARVEADRSSRIAGAVTDFFTLDVLNLEPLPRGAPELTVRQVLERIPEKIDRHFKSDPAIEGAIRERVGQLYLNMGDARRASEFLEPAAELLEKGLGPDHKTTLMARQRLGRLLFDLGRYEHAAVVFDQVYQSRRRVLGPEATFTLNSLIFRGRSLILAGKPGEGLPDVEHGAAEAQRLWGPESQPAIMFSRDLIESYLFADMAGPAEEKARAQLILIASDPSRLSGAEPDFRALLGAALLAQSRFAEAMTELDIAWNAVSPTLPDSHPKIVTLRTRRGIALAGVGRYAEAAAELSVAYSVIEPVYGPAAARCRELARALTDVATHLGDEAAAALWRSRS
jgi:eukaryotic-like serine/threonine-protein kinase